MVLLNIFKIFFQFRLFHPSIVVRCEPENEINTNLKEWNRSFNFLKFEIISHFMTFQRIPSPKYNTRKKTIIYWRTRFGSITLWNVFFKTPLECWIVDLVDHSIKKNGFYKLNLTKLIQKVQFEYLSNLIKYLIFWNGYYLNDWARQENFCVRKFWNLGWIFVLGKFHKFSQVRWLLKIGKFRNAN